MGGDRKRYLEKNVRGYQAVEAVIKTLLSEHKQQTHVLAMEGITPSFSISEKRKYHKRRRLVRTSGILGPL